MITFLREWWSCRQKQPSQQESRPGAGDIRRCQSYARFHNSHRKAQNTAGNPKNGEQISQQSSPKLTTVLINFRQSTNGQCIKILPRVTRWCQGPELKRFGPLGWFCCVWCQKALRRGANGEITRKGGVGGGVKDEWWRLILEQGNCFVSPCQGAI